MVTAKKAARRSAPVARKAPAKKAAPKPAAKAARGTEAPAAPEPTKPPKVKLVRDGFTIPRDEYAVIDALKLRAAKLGRIT
jgi:hypothetical protein